MNEGLAKYLDAHPDTKMVIFAGKGGLGKSTCSAALGVYLASKRGVKTLTFSTDPQASLSDVFERDLYGKGEVEVIKNLYVVEIDADRRVNEYIEGVRNRIRDMYKMDEIPPEIESYLESSKAEPAMYESATYDAMVEYLAEGKYDYYIFDMPPFGHGLRMIAMAEVLNAWVERITEAREKAKEYEDIASRLRGGSPVTEDAVLNELYEIRDKLSYFRNTMLDRDRTAFFIVMTPEKLSILDTERALEMFKSLGIELSGVVINQILPREMIDNPSKLVSNKAKLQWEYMEEIKDKFGDMIVASIPMFEREPKGIEMLERVAKYLVEEPLDIGGG